MGREVRDRDAPSHSETPARTAAIAPPSRQASRRWSAAPRNSRWSTACAGTRFGRHASRAGVHSNESHSIRNERRKIAQTWPRATNGIDAYISPRADVGGDHQLLAIDPIDDRAGEGTEEDRRRIRAVITTATAPSAAAATRRAAPRAMVTATNPPSRPGRRRPSRRASREKAGWAEQVSQRRRPGPAERRDLLGVRSATTPPRRAVPTPWSDLRSGARDRPL